ncbi:hypothetical protein T07_8987 [Trichinella nelsoni]|uniref:Uncharacterized protein n=1 Tax=Trichinella nelsoni TaxID=6336 RepID=A0A0V0RQQ7_9BILA|nr:hypothetical protein T07_8987 [Trichinella nelsoni]
MQYKNKLLHIKTKALQNEISKNNSIFCIALGCICTAVKTNLTFCVSFYPSTVEAKWIKIKKEEEEERINNSFDNVDVVQKGERPGQELSWVKKKFLFSNQQSSNLNNFYQSPPVFPVSCRKPEAGFSLSSAFSNGSRRNKEYLNYELLVHHFGFRDSFTFT